ncbi:MAG: isoprenylcysteine carboxylmethyltransferase family protein [Acidobacteria bacterium]|nr:isoprenylcysteine carboxylmethyltransferase family protein [Acidobacteriota bacterium]
MISLLLRNLLFTVLQPGLVAGLVPYLILRAGDRSFRPESPTIGTLAGGVLFVAGLIILTICILRFATEGRGTLSPLDPTRKLVVRGLYKYSRNPMYVGVMLMLAGECLFWPSWGLAVYAAVVFAAFNLFIRLHEEPRLRRDFGPEYENYRRRVRRWI